MTTETQGKTENEYINPAKQQTQPTKLESPKADALDQARLRALTLSFTEPLFKKCAYDHLPIGLVFQNSWGLDPHLWQFRERMPSCDKWRKELRV